MKYSEAGEQIKELSDDFSVELNDTNDFYVVYQDHYKVAYVNGTVEFGVHADYYTSFLEVPKNKEVFKILAELASTPLEERVEEKKYQVKVFGDYLNVPVGDLHPFLFYGGETEKVKTCFTLKEIEELKQRDDVPLDWDKVRLEEAR